MTQWSARAPMTRHHTWTGPAFVGLLALLAACACAACWYLYGQTQGLTQMVSDLERDLSANERAVIALDAGSESRLALDQSFVDALTDLDGRLMEVESDLGSTYEFQSVNSRIQSLTGRVDSIERDVSSLCSTLLFNTDLFISC